LRNLLVSRLAVLRRSRRQRARRRCTTNRRRRRIAARAITVGNEIMQANRDYLCWGAAAVLLACASSFAACSDEGGAASTDMATASNQPGTGGAGGSGPGGNAGSGMMSSSGSSGNNSALAGSSALGAGESPGMNIGLNNGGEGPATSAGGGNGMPVDPACAVDSDSDTVKDCDDGCPMDLFKTQPGVCGCGVPDTDVDVDGTLDCQEMCPTDPLKLVPGVCGCGRADADTDGDGALDCNDGCPYDGTLLAPGDCGCGAPANLPLCLRHRYSFSGAGTVASDSAGTDDGTIVNTTLAGNGTLVLAGGVTEQYVNLPANIISRLGASATIETWVNWTGAGAPWQRIFDFGSSELPAGQQGTGVTYLFVAPSTASTTHLRAAFTTAGPAQERTANGPTSLPFGAPSHIALVIDGPAQTLTLYQNGAQVDVPIPTLDTTLALLNDVNNWIGRSQFAADEEFQGVVDEVRIYSAARSAQQIAAEFSAGPDTLPEQ
jgi:hypothetical protein